MRFGIGGPLQRPAVLMFLLSVVLCGALGSAKRACAESEAPAGSASSVLPSHELHNKPNVIWILLDACRPDHLSCYGYERNTSPNIDRLAARGVVFERCYAQANVTLLSVPSFLTGRYFPVCTFAPIHWRAESRIRPQYEEYISETFKRNGYKTAIITAHPGITPVGRLRRTFDLYKWPKGDAGKHYAEFDELNKTILLWLKQLKGNPFFLYVHSLDTHGPHYIHHGHDMWVDRSKSNSWVEDLEQNASESVSVSTEAGRHYVGGAYDGSIHFADAHVGVIVRELDGLGMLDDTILIITADHGEVLAEDGKTVGHPNGVTAQELIHVPLIIAGPGLPEGVRITQLTQNADITPSLVDLLGLETQGRYDGCSFVPLMKNIGADPLHEYVLFKSRYGYYNEDDLPILALYDGNYTYELNPHTSAEHLWQMPDRFGNRTDVVNSKPEEAAGMKARITQHVLPLWEQYTQLPQTTVGEFVVYIVEAIEKQRVFPEGAWVGVNDPSDGKWTLQGRDLFCYPWSEKTPQLELRFHVPNGRYKVQLSLFKGEKEGHFASAVNLKVQGETAFRPVEPDAGDRAEAPPGQTKLGYVDVGVCSVSDGRFIATLDAADSESFASARAFRFQRLGDAVSETSAEAREELEERLRGLGYLE